MGVYLLSFLYIIISCTSNTREETIPSESTTFSELDISYCDILTNDQHSSEKLHAFVSQNDTFIIQGFNDFWSHLSIGYEGYEIRVIDSTIFKLGEEKFQNLKVEVTYREDNLVTIANNLYLLKISNPNKYTILNQTGYFQPECDTPDFFFSSLGVINYNSQRLYFIDKLVDIYGCISTPNIRKTSLVLFNDNGFQTMIGELIIDHRITLSEMHPDTIKVSKFYQTEDRLAKVTRSVVDNTLFSIDTSYYIVKNNALILD